MASKFDIQSAIRARGNQQYVVELEGKVITPKVTRRGKAVPQTKAKPDELEALLERIPRSDPKAQPRVISQSVEAGERVSPGTEIDISLVSRDSVPVRIYPDVHVSMRDLSIENVLTDYLNDNDVLETVLKYENYEDVPEVERRKVDAKVKEREDAGEIEIDEAIPERGKGAVYKAMRNSAAYL